VKKSKIAQNSLPVPCSQLRVPLPQRQFLTPTYLGLAEKVEKGKKKIDQVVRQKQR
jgi:hypothetical protein